MKFSLGFICGFVLFLIEIANGGYIVTAPNRLIPDRNETVCISLHNLNSTEDVNVAVTLSIYVRYHSWRPNARNQRNKTLQRVTTVLRPSSNKLQTCVKVQVPLSHVFSNALLLLNVTGKQKGGSYEFSDSKVLSIFTYGDSKFTFIQTDKPIYKPGQTVRFRVLSLDNRLRPLLGYIDEVVVSSPDGTRVSQWLNKTTQTGLGDFELVLSEEPRLGRWKIKVTRGDKKEMARFTVDEYVLPKFEVSIEPPAYVTIDTTEITVQVCARYTYGEPVRGFAYLTTCLQKGYHTVYRYGGIYPPERDGISRPCHLAKFAITDKHGCGSVNISHEAIGYDEMTGYVWGSELKYSAYLVEKGTDVRLNATDKQTSFYAADIEVKMEGRDSFKPGIPYNGKVQVMHPDQTPAAGKNISISISDFRDGEKYVKYYLSGSDGYIYFTIPPVVEDKTSFSIDAKAVDYHSTSRGVPSANLRVKSWYSPKGRYIQFAPQEGTLKCETEAELQLLYSTNQQENITLTIVVVGPGDIANFTHHEVTLEANMKVGGVDNTSSSWDKSTIDRNWWYRPRIIYYDYDYGYSADLNNESSTTKAVKTTTAPKQPPVTVAAFYGTLTIKVPIGASMSPAARVLAYYVADDGEVVSDEVAVDVEPCTDNMVMLNFDKVKGTPGEDVKMSLETSASSLCAYGAVDKSVFLKGGDNQLSLGTIASLIGRYRLTKYSHAYNWDDNYCEKRYGSDSHGSQVRGKRSSYISNFGRYYTEYEDSKEAFDSAGIVVMTDLTLETKPCTRQHYGNDGRPRAMMMMPMTRGDGDLRVGASLSSSLSSAGDRSTQSKSGSDSLPALTVRDYFPETWLWSLVNTDSDGKAEVVSKLPHTITEWIGNAVCVSEEKGLGVSKPSSVTTYQSFFVSATLPYSAIRGETIPLALTVFNYMDKCLPVQLRLKSSADYRVYGDSTINSCVCSKDSTTSDFMIILNKIGVVNLTVTATIISNGGRVCDSTLEVDTTLVGRRDAIIKPLIVEPEGAAREYTVSDFICQQGSDPVDLVFLWEPGGRVRLYVPLGPGGPVGSWTLAVYREDGTNHVIVATLATYLSYLFSTRQMSFPIPDEQILVPDSVRSFISVVGDVMGPALSNLDNLLRMPYGCGEQNMVGFSPNVFVLQYLEGTNRDSERVRKQAISHMQSGYQRELRYRHTDGSYSAFGPGAEEGSMWLTAFVVKCFAQASPFIYIDPQLQRKSITYFTESQLPSGCFPQVGMVHSKYMQGGIGRARDGTVPLSAYVLITLLESGMNSSDDSVTKAVLCLSVQPITDNYTLALMTYAFSLYDRSNPKTIELYNNLTSRADKADSTKTWWRASSPKVDDDKGQDDTWWYRPRSADVETTAYALLATLTMTDSETDKITHGLPIVKWLSQQRNAYGGFGSTQDTVVGLQALAKFASLLYSDGLDLSVSVKSRSMVTAIATFQITDDNSLVTQETKMSELTDVNVETRGSGCFLLQGTVKYNVYADLLRRGPFSTSVSDFRSDSGNDPCKQRKLHVCTRYTGKGSSTNMAVIQLRMVSGWSANKASLKALLKNKQRNGLRRYDVEKNNDVQLYFNEITRANLCFGVEIERVMNVRDAKPAVITVYDYYKKEISSDTEYDIVSMFCPDKPRTNTKEDLPEITPELYINSRMQARRPPQLPSNFVSGLEMEVRQVNATRCPTCHSADNLFNVTSDICSFGKAYKVSWRARTNNPMTVMADLRPSTKKKFKKVFVSYKLPINCSCVSMFNAAKGDKLVILGNWEDYIESNELLQIGDGAIVFPLTKELERNINKATKKCPLTTPIV